LTKTLRAIGFTIQDDEEKQHTTGSFAIKQATDTAIKNIPLKNLPNTKPNTNMIKIFLQITRRVLWLCLCCQAVLAQSILLPKEAKFKFGDNLQWAAPEYNDSDWAMQQLGKSFSKDSSYAWYRIKIIIPSAMKTSSGKGIKLYLGKIDDADQTFFNGTVIGETGSFPPQYVTQWEKQRVYTIPQNAVQWDKENIIAVRVYNLVGGMGMWQGPYSAAPVGWADEVLLQQDFVATPHNGFTSTIVFTNTINQAFNGTVKFWVTNKANNKILFTETKPVHLAATKGATAAVVSADFYAANENVFNAGYQVNDDSSILFVKKEQLYIATSDLIIPFTGQVQPLVKDKIPNRFTAPSFADEQYNGYLNTRFTQNLQQRLLKVDEFGLMGSYMNRPGIHPWAGEHVGKYLETACNVWKLTHDTTLKKQMDRMMYELINTQLEDGYLGTYTPDEYWTSWDVWSHKYNLHGLLAYYATTGYMPALEACKKMGNLLCNTFGKKAGQKDIILAGEHMGMAATSVLDAMVELYQYTAEKKYLDFCYYILDAWEQDNGPHVISAVLATGKVTKVGNGKAYEMLSNYVGLIKLYQVTGEEKFFKAVTTAWQDVVANRLYITGTASTHEYFGEDAVLPAAAMDNMGEGCVTTTWIQLNQNLFAITGDIKYLNELEKSVYNHLLAAENPETGCVSYYTPLMDKKPYTCFITCCQSSVPRGISLVPNFTFGNINSIPTVLFYEPAQYKEKVITTAHTTVDVGFIVAGNFPESGNVVVTITSLKPASFAVALRVPYWCTNYTATVQGRVYKGQPNQFITINKNWQPGQKVMIHFDMPLTIIAGGKSYPGQFAFKRGPQILAADKSLNTATVNNLFLNTTTVAAPTLTNTTAVLPAHWIGTQAYSLNLLPANNKLIVVPFADASQTDGDMKVWLPVQIKK